MAISMLAAAATQFLEKSGWTPHIREMNKAAKAAPPSEGDSNLSSLSSSPHQFPTDLSSPIFEEGDETESEPINEPITPVSGRLSQDFRQSRNSHDLFHLDHVADDSFAVDSDAPTLIGRRVDSDALIKLSALELDTDTPQPDSYLQAARPIDIPAKNGSNQHRRLISKPAPSSPVEQDPAVVQTHSVSRRNTCGSNSGSFVRTMSSLFRRSSSNTAVYGDVAGSRPDLYDVSQQQTQQQLPRRRWSLNRSSATTRSNTPPSPIVPGVTAAKMREQASEPTVTRPDQFNDSVSMISTPARASTGLSLRSRATKVLKGGHYSNHDSPDGFLQPRHPRRASSFDFPRIGRKTELAVGGDGGRPNPNGAERDGFPLPVDTGAGVKARRMSVSLPDDFTVDVVDLQAEYEYTRFLGRHGKHIGRGATSKVTLMLRKGTEKELYAVKEFRGKTSSETLEEYETKIKSEYTIAKSLHHPNIIETVRLCRDHGRWNHVMEYCQEGDVFGLVKKGYLRKDEREKDRLCLFKQLVQGVNYLHSNGIAHRDIKLENLLITGDSRLKITDFGVSEVFSGIHPGVREAGGQCGREMGDVRLCSPGICGSRPYISPEVLSREGPYDARGLDVWGTAVVMLHLVFGGPAWGAATTDQWPVYASLVQGWDKWNTKHAEGEMLVTELDYPAVPVFDEFVNPPALRRLLLQMLNPNPARRLSIDAVAKNRWFKNIECCQPESFDDPVLAIDASKKACLKRGSQRKIFCHNHLPPSTPTSHSLGKMPGSVGY